MRGDGRRFGHPARLLRPGGPYLSLRNLAEASGCVVANQRAPKGEPQPEIYCPYCLSVLTTPEAIALHEQLQESAKAIRASSQAQLVRDENPLLRGD
jgi:hypothetical protein